MTAPPPTSYFTLEPDGHLLPTARAVSLWSEDQLHGVALSGALARAAEQRLATLERPDVRPARLTVDLFAAVRRRPVEVTSTLVRVANRIVVVDASIRQDGEVVARATVSCLRGGGGAPGTVWEPKRDGLPPLPPPDLAPTPDRPQGALFRSGDAAWSTVFADHQDAGRKALWLCPADVVEGEASSPFVSVAAAADNASMTVNWGDGGIGHINSDLTLSLGRLPVSRAVGLVALDRLEHDGVAAGVVQVFDREGVVGSVAVSGLANARRAVDAREVRWGVTGPRARSRS